MAEFKNKKCKQISNHIYFFIKTYNFFKNQEHTYTPCVTYRATARVWCYPMIINIFLSNQDVDENAGTLSMMLIFG